MAQTSNAIRNAYTKRTYQDYKLRVRRNSDLNTAIQETLNAKGASLNYLVTKLLAAHYGVPMPDPHLDNQ